MPDGLFANPLHWVILLVVVLIIFGPGKLPGVGAALGKSVREFKKATEDDSPAASSTGAPSAGPLVAMSAPPATVIRPACPDCGHENDPGVRFCGNCGASLLKASEPEVETEEPAPRETGPVHCPDCQTPNPAANHFCAHCGRLIEHSLNRV